MKEKLSAFMTRYRFLIRLVMFGLLLLLVFSLSSTVMISSRSLEQLRETNETAIRATARSVDDIMQNYLGMFEKIGRSFIESPHTYEQNIRTRKQTTDPSGQLISYVEEQFKGYSMSMPLLSSMCIYYHASHCAFYADFPLSGSGNLNTGWGTMAVYQHMVVPEVNATEFLKCLDGITEPMFYPSEALLEEGRMLYLVPVSINPMVETRRVIIFDISAASFQKLLSTTLIHHTAVETLSWRGQLIYHQPGEENARRFMHENENGFSVTVRMPEEEYESLFAGFSSSILRLGISSVLLSGLLIALFVAFSYQPLNHIVQHTGMRNTDEISAVKGYISHKEQLENELRTELENEKELTLIKHLEMLLLGIPYDAPESVLPDGSYFVAVSPLTCFPAVNEAICTLKSWEHVIAFEQYRSGYLVMVVNAAGKDLQSFHSSYEDAFGAKVGVGSLCSTPEQLHRSYLEAVLSLNGVSAQSDPSEALDPSNILQMEEFETFRAQLIANDKSCLQTLESMFARLDTIEPSLFLYWHCSFQLMERICRLLQEYGYPVNTQALLAFHTGQDLRRTRENVLSTIAGLLEEGPYSESLSEKELGESIVQFIRENIGNELFSISDIMECFNLSEYTISRLMKDKTNLNFKKYLTEVRLEKAKELLGTSSLSIQDIAVRCGFSSSSYFIRVFKSNTSITPLQYRRSVLGV